MLNHKLGFTRVDFDHRMGFSLVEVLIALLITIISVVSLLNFLVTSLQVNYTSSAISEDLLDKSGNLEARTAAVQIIEASIDIDGVEITGELYEIDYGKSKKLIEFARNSDE
jgi:Tfp pilus assembly protein PilW